MPDGNLAQFGVKCLIDLRDKKDSEINALKERIRELEKENKELREAAAAMMKGLLVK